MALSNRWKILRYLCCFQVMVEFPVHKEKSGTVMKFLQRLVIIIFLMMAIIFPMQSCKEKKEGKVVVTESEFILRQDSESAYVIDARGKVKNVGDVDVKNLVITGFCRSCGELINPGNWFISEVEKTPEQKDKINYLPVGDEESFSFKGVAFIYNMVPKMPESKPEKMEIVIESFETVGK